MCNVDWVSSFRSAVSTPRFVNAFKKQAGRHHRQIGGLQIAFHRFENSARLWKEARSDRITVRQAWSR
jgi:hypothetical protein